MRLMTWRALSIRPYMTVLLQKPANNGGTSDMLTQYTTLPEFLDATLTRLLDLIKLVPSQAGVVESNVSTDVGSTINCNQDVGKCSYVGQPP